MDFKKNKKKYYSVISISLCILLGIIVVFVYIDQQTPDYSTLFGEDYQELLDAIGEPINDPNVPTISQINSWLALDNTDNILYIEDVWMCGDYAGRITVNAKEKGWRIYVVIMFYSLDGESGYGSNTPNGNTGHAFNVVYCQDGDDEGEELDVWYIEPQADTIWQLYDGHYSSYNYYFSIPDTIWNTVYWVNYYEYVG